MVLIFQILSLLTLQAVESKPVQPLLLDEVLIRTRSYAPKVLASLAKVESARQKVVASQGQFDPSLDFNGYKRSSDVYPGETIEGKIEKPISYLNSKVFAGYRKSDGKFPSYEGKRVTLDEGEILAGVSMSLLRNFSTDKKRLKLNLSQLNFNATSWRNKEVLMKLQKEASIAYWNWVAAGHTFKVLEGLLQLATERQSAFERRIKQGDLAALYAVENKQYILKRKTKLLKADAELRMAALYLSLFYRNEEGNPIVAPFTMIPKLSTMKKSQLSKVTKVEFSSLMEKSFSLNALRVEIDSIEKQVEFYDSRFLPELRFKYEVNRDNGQGPATLVGTDHKFYLNLNIPLERNLLSGNLKSQMAQKKILIHERKLMEDSMKIGLESLKIKLDTTTQIIENTEGEIDLGVRLEKAERRKFFSGASDYFVINLREQNTVDARLKNIESLFDFQETTAKYREILMDFPLPKSVN